MLNPSNTEDEAMTENKTSISYHVESEYELLVNLAKDLTARNGRGFSRSNLTYMRKFYLAFPKCEIVSHKLTWSHYFELLKCDDRMEFQFYFHKAKE